MDVLEGNADQKQEMRKLLGKPKGIRRKKDIRRGEENYFALKTVEAEFDR